MNLNLNSDSELRPLQQQPVKRWLVAALLLASLTLVVVHVYMRGVRTAQRLAEASNAAPNSVADEPAAASNAAHGSIPTETPSTIPAPKTTSHSPSQGDTAKSTSPSQGRGPKEAKGHDNAASVLSSPSTRTASAQTARAAAPSPIATMTKKAVASGVAGSSSASAGSSAGANTSGSGPSQPSGSVAGNGHGGSADAPLAAGEKELRTGQQYLAGDGVTRNSAEAAKWFWRAVAYRNAAAAVALANLYAHGEGVAKNCEQAKILLDSAARRGVDAAGAQLKKLNEGGCP